MTAPGRLTGRTSLFENIYNSGVLKFPSRQKFCQEVLPPKITPGGSAW